MISAESKSAVPKVRARFTLLIALAVLAAGCSPEATPKLIVGMELAYPPFEMTDPQGRPTGVSVDLARALGKFLSQEIQIQNLPFDGLIPSLQTRKIDLIISSLTATPERAKSIDFSEPYLKTGLCLLVGKKSPIQSIEDMDQPGRTLAVKLGTTGHAYARQKINRARVLVLEQESEHPGAVDFLAGIGMACGAEFDGQSSAGLIHVLNGLNGRFLADQQAEAGF